MIDVVLGYKRGRKNYAICHGLYARIWNSAGGRGYGDMEWTCYFPYLLCGVIWGDGVFLYLSRPAGVSFIGTADEQARILP
jgi:hypothetical protein